LAQTLGFVVTLNPGYNISPNIVEDFNC